MMVLSGHCHLEPGETIFDRGGGVEEEEGANVAFDLSLCSQSQIGLEVRHVNQIHTPPF